MGTKRVGLARIEALMENLKREVAGFNVENTAASVTTVTAAGALARNSVNHINRATAMNVTLPPAAECSRGDIIVCKYIGAINNGQLHKYGTSGEFLASHSCLFGKAAEDGDSQDVKTLITAPNGTSNDFLNLTGATNGQGGIGTILKFHFDGSQWAVNGQLEKQGDGSAAATAVFADT